MKSGRPSRKFSRLLHPAWLNLPGACFAFFGQVDWLVLVAVGFVLASMGCTFWYFDDVEPVRRSALAFALGLAVALAHFCVTLAVVVGGCTVVVLLNQ